jgi:hypothetical protein
VAWLADLISQFKDSILAIAAQAAVNNILDSCIVFDHYTSSSSGSFGCTCGILLSHKERSCNYDFLSLRFGVCTSKHKVKQVKLEHGYVLCCLKSHSSGFSTLPRRFCRSGIKVQVKVKLSLCFN